jgi:MoxR-like ATPase
VSPIRKEIAVDYVPQTMKDYVAFGYHSDVQTIIKSGQFYPVFISGLSGNGKTTMVEQICAKLNRECFRVNISVETDEDALVGGHTLVNGNVVYREGPVLTAMRRGAILLLDEIDRGSDKLICLQAILEGKPYLNKKTGETVLPSPGFNVLATANTKGFGSDDGKFSAARVLDEAFLERFAVAIEQDYPSNAVEKKIVLNQMTSKNCVNAEFANYLVNWAEIIRKTYADGGIDYVVSTRRLVNIVDAFAMFGDRMKAIKLCINRFDSETRNAFEELYCKIDDTQNKMTETSEVPTPEVV